MIDIVFKTLILAFSFAVAGIIARTIAGPASSYISTLIGGALAGAVIGIAASLSINGKIELKFIMASAMGLGLANLLAAVFVNFKFGVNDLLLFGIISGLAFAISQYLATKSLPYALIVFVCWALGWPLMQIIGVDVEKQYHIFGLVSATIFSVLLSVCIYVGIVKAT